MKIKDLKPKYRWEAFDNIAKRDIDITIKTALNLDLDVAFLWEDSKEGFVYWNNINKSVKTNNRYENKGHKR